MNAPANQPTTILPQDLFDGWTPQTPQEQILWDLLRPALHIATLVNEGEADYESDAAPVASHLLAQVESRLGGVGAHLLAEVAEHGASPPP